MGARLKRILPVFGAVIAICLLLQAGCPNPLLGIVKKEVANFAGKPEIQISRGGAVIQSGGTTDIGTAVVGGTAKIVTFAVENVGSASLQLEGAPAISGTGTTSFSIGTPPYSVIDPGENSVFTLEFSPISAVTKTIVITVRSNDADEAVYDFFVNGTGVSGPGPEIQVSQGSTNLDLTYDYAFPSIQAGTSEDIVFTISNIGTPGENLGLSANPVSITGGAGVFTIISQPSSTTIPEGGSTSFTLRFSPTAGVQADYNASVSIGSTNDTDENPYNFAISGSGLVPNIVVQKGATVLSSGAYAEAFGDIMADGNDEQASPTVTYTIYNTGLWPLTLTGVIITGTNPTDFDLNNATSSPVAPGANTSFTVRFDPLTRGAGRQATVTISSSDPDTGSFTFAVSGNGIFAPKVFWVNKQSGQIWKANLNGSNPEIVLGGLPQPVGLAIDQNNNMMYWTDISQSQVRRANLDGTGAVPVLGLSQPYGITLDVPNNQMYVITFGARIYKAKLDGSSPSDVGIFTQGFGIAVDGPNSALYWTDYDASVWYGTTNLAIAGQLIGAASGYTSGLALDLTSRYVYWAVKNSGYIFRSSLDSPSPEMILSGLGGPNFIALDLGNQKMYWTEAFSGYIFRTNLDGSSREVVVGGQPLPYGIALDLVP